VALNARDAMLAQMSEASLQSTIIAAAREHGWLVHHDEPAMTAKGRWLTNVRGDPGFPDLVLARDGEVIIVELKAMHGRWQKGQREWLHALGAQVLRPDRMDSLIARLRQPRPRLTPERMRRSMMPPPPAP